MNNNITFSIIKPTAVKQNNSIKILAKIDEAGFKVLNIKLIHLTKKQATMFYNIHKEQVFFNSLVEYMCSAPVFVMVLEKDNAVQDFRKLIGSTNPEQAQENTIRKLFGISVSQNAIHGSDSDENAIIESSFFFSVSELSMIND